MRILITGRDGQVGWELQRALSVLGDVIAIGRRECDLASPDAIRATVRSAAPDLIINAAAYTAVDRAESDRDAAFAINCEAPRVLAEEAKQIGCGLIHYSTDYVFDGEKSGAYSESDATHPVSIYGKSKLNGELAIQAESIPHLIFRTSWVYAARGGNFMRTMLRLSREREELRIVADQRGAPTWARHLAEATACVVARAGTNRKSIVDALLDKGGLYHMTSRDVTSWYEFAKSIFELVPDPNRKLSAIVPITTGEYPTPACRPRNSALDNSKLTAYWNIALPDWRDALALCASDIV